MKEISLVDPPTSGFPFELPTVRALKEGLALHPKVTFLVGENGTGKSTLMEGLADKWGFDLQSGNRSQSLAFRNYQTELGPFLRLSRLVEARPLDGFFLRAESFFNFATEMDELESDLSTANGYFKFGGKSLHERSHGESFFSLFNDRFGEHGFYLLDEPEAALSPARQLALLVRLHDLVEGHCQFVIATHSPIIMAYPEAWIYELDESGIRRIEFGETEHVRITRRFLNDREGMLGRLLEEGNGA
ncbi:MAG: AAA family ATPase [Verrucomicrobiota bacterium]